MIIVDDGSTDDTGRFLDAIGDPRVQVVRKSNAGQQWAANQAIEMCTTELTVRFDADDICKRNRLQSQVEFMNAHPEVELLGRQFNCCPQHERCLIVAIQKKGLAKSSPVDNSAC